MRNRHWFLGILVLLVITLPASAQITAAFGSKTTGTAIPSSIPTFMSGAMLKQPDYSSMSLKPMMPGPLNMSNFMPSTAWLQNTMLMRNLFSTPATNIQTQAAPPVRQSSSLFLP